jgi:hypothetical protein
MDKSGNTGEMCDGDDQTSGKENSKEVSNRPGSSRSGDEQQRGGGSGTNSDGDGEGATSDGPNDAGDNRRDSDDNDENDDVGGGNIDQDDKEEQEEEEEGEASDGKSETNGNAEAGEPAGQAPAAQTEGNWMSFESLMNETYPAKSKAVYQAAFVKFELFLKAEKKFEPNVAPTETMFLNYFHFLRTVKFWGATTIWSTYSRLNAVLKRRYKVSLKSYPSITDLLKSYEVGHRVKKASVFTPQQEFTY